MSATRSALCGTTRRPPTWTRHSRCRIFTWGSLQSVPRMWRRLGANSDERSRFLIAKTLREFCSSEGDLRARPSSSFAARNFAPVEAPLDVAIACYCESRGTTEGLRSSASGSVFFGHRGTDGRSDSHPHIPGRLRNQGERGLGPGHRQENCCVSVPYS